MALRMFTLEVAEQPTGFNDAQLAAVAFLARYSGRTLDAFRHDLAAGGGPLRDTRGARPPPGIRPAR